MQNERTFLSDMLLPSAYDRYIVELVGNCETRREFSSYFDMFKYIGSTETAEKYKQPLRECGLECFWLVKRYKNDELYSEFRLSDMGKLLDFKSFKEEAERSVIVSTGDIIFCKPRFGVYIGYDGIHKKHICISNNVDSQDMLRDNSYDKEIRSEDYSVVYESKEEILNKVSYLVKQEPQYYLKWLGDWDAYKIKFPDSAAINIQQIIAGDWNRLNNGGNWFR